MTTAVTMPEVAETVVEGTVARWLKREGDRVEMYEALVEIVTDKVNVEVPSPVKGVLTKILATENTTIPVGAQLALIEEEAASGTGTGPVEPSTTPVTFTGAEQEAAVDGRGEQPRASPLVRRLAAEHGVDIGQVRGTGFRGRVRKQDILDYLAQRDRAPRAPAPSPAPKPAAPAPAAGDQVVPLTPVRATIARRMVKSKQEVPHAWATFEVDVTGLVRLRESVKDDFLRREGVKLTYLPFFVKAVVSALKEFPSLNALWSENGIVIKKEINIGIAVDRDEGLIVPVIRRADEQSIAMLARSIDALVTKARENKLTIEDVQGGTFTVNNTGSFGTVLSMPIINQPQAAILATEAIVRRPAVVGDAIAIRSMMHLSISFDHRVLDGGEVGRFMQSVKRKLEAYGPDTALY